MKEGGWVGRHMGVEMDDRRSKTGKTFIIS